MQGPRNAIAIGAGRVSLSGRDEVTAVTEHGVTDFKLGTCMTALLNIDIQNCFIEISPVAPRGRDVLTPVPVDQRARVMPLGIA